MSGYVQPIALAPVMPGVGSALVETHECPQRTALDIGKALDYFKARDAALTSLFSGF